MQSDLNLGPEPTNHLTPPLSPPHLSPPPPLSPLPGSTLKNCVDGGRGLMTARCVQAIMCAHNVQVAIMGGCSEVITPDQLMITRSPGQGGRGQNFTTHCEPSPASSCIIGQTIRHRGEHNHPLRRCITALWFCVFYLDSRTSRTDIFGVAPKHRSTICVEHILEEHNGHQSARLQGAKWARSVSIRL